MSINIGDRWNGYTVASLIGEGSYGKVYKITREEFGHTYASALKVIRVPQSEAEVNSIRSSGMDDESVTAYFRGVVEDIVNEVALMAEFKGHSNIVSYEGHSVVPLKDGFGWEVFIQMELLTPLFDCLKSNAFTVNEVIRLGIDMCNALELCEKNHIIHRDIKPENIFYSKLGTFKLGDFGIAREMERSTSGMSKKGTYSYMAPEVYRGDTYDQTVDSYSLGIVLYRLLNNNRTPFLPPYPDPIRYADNETAIRRRLSGERIPMPCNAGDDLGRVVLKACAYDPRNRYRTAWEMRLALEAAARSAGVRTTAGDYAWTGQNTGRSVKPADEVWESDGERSKTVSMFDIPGKTQAQPQVQPKAAPQPAATGVSNRQQTVFQGQNPYAGNRQTGQPKAAAKPAAAKPKAAAPKKKPSRLLILILVSLFLCGIIAVILDQFNTPHQTGTDAPAQTTAEEPAWKETYRTLLTQIAADPSSCPKDLMYDTTSFPDGTNDIMGTLSYERYFLCDVDRNGTPELFIPVWNDIISDWTYYVLTIYNGNVDPLLFVPVSSINTVDGSIIETMPAAWLQKNNWDEGYMIYTSIDRMAGNSNYDDYGNHTVVHSGDIFRIYYGKTDDIGQDYSETEWRQYVNRQFSTGTYSPNDFTWYGITDFTGIDRWS